MMVHLDPDFAKHRAGREVMQRLEDTFGEPGVEGPGVEVGQRLAMWPLKCATWSRVAHKAGDGSQTLSQAELERQTVDYMVVYFTVRSFGSQYCELSRKHFVQGSTSGRLYPRGLLLSPIPSRKLSEYQRSGSCKKFQFYISLVIPSLKTREGIFLAGMRTATRFQASFL